VTVELEMIEVVTLTFLCLVVVGVTVVRCLVTVGICQLVTVVCSHHGYWTGW